MAHRPAPLRTTSGETLAGEVSVVVPTFNAQDTVEAALRSVLAQEPPPCEVVVVDDASADATLARVAALGDPRVRVEALRENVGPGAARNVGLALARGEFTAFLDADDVWLPGKLAKQLAAMRADPTRTLVTCDSVYRTPQGAFKRRSHDVLPPAEGPDAWKTLLAYNFMPTPTVMARRDVLLELGGFATELRFGEDLDLWIRASLRGSVGVVREVLVEIVEWSGSLTGTIRHTQPDFVLPYIARYLEERAADLTPGEVRAIRGRRFYESGTVLFYAGRTLSSLPYFLRAAAQGYRVGKSLSFLPKTLVSLATLGRYPGTQH